MTLHYLLIYHKIEQIVSQVKVLHNNLKPLIKYISIYVLASNANQVKQFECLANPHIFYNI